MAVGPAIFQSAGQRSEHYVPGAYSRSAAIGGAGGISAGNGALLGKSSMGAPRQLNVFSSLQEAKEILGDGELLRAIAHAFNPSPDFTPQAIRAMVVNGNTQSARTLRAGSMEVLALKSAMYGLPANRLSMRLTGGSNPGTRKIAFEHEAQTQTIDNIGKQSIQLHYIGSGNTAVLDINNTGLSLEISRNDNYPALDITGLNGLRVGEIKDFQVSATNPAAADIMAIADIIISGMDKTLLKLEYLNPETGNTWEVIDTDSPFRGPDGFALQTMTLQFRLTPLAGAEGSILSYRIRLRQVVNGVITNNVIAETTTGRIAIAAPNMPYSGFNIPAYDAASGSFFLAFEDFPTIEALTARLNASGEVAAIQLETEPNVPSAELDAISALDCTTNPQTLTSNFYAVVHALENSYFIGTANVAKIADAASILPDNDADPVYFEGASGGTYTIDDWNSALSALEAENIQIISTPSTDQAVHTLIANHCKAMSNVVNRKERTALLGGPIGETIEQALKRAASLNSSYVSYCYPAINAQSPLTGAAELLPASYFACKLLGLECAAAVNEPLTWKNVSVNQFLVRLKTSEMEHLIRGGILCGGITDDNRLAVIRAMTTYQGNQLQLVERSMVREDLFMNRDIRNQYSTGIGRPDANKDAAAEQTLLGAARAWKAEGLIVPDDNGNNVWDIITRKSGDKTFITFSRNLTAPHNFFFITANNYVYECKTTVEI